MDRRRTAAGIAVIMAAAGQGVMAGGIDLDCVTLSRQMVERLAAENLLNDTDPGRQHALAVTRELCGEAEATARQQHEAGKQEALDNWFFETHPEKAGNRRLKNLKR
ncbi:MAG: hypothetical protein PVH54_12495 [Gammaproteobacteria bacterium]|jgi:hypothetical protein